MFHGILFISNMELGKDKKKSEASSLSRQEHSLEITRSFIERLEQKESTRRFYDEVTHGHVSFTSASARL